MRVILFEIVAFDDSGVLSMFIGAFVDEDNLFVGVIHIVFLYRVKVLPFHRAAKGISTVVIASAAEQGYLALVFFDMEFLFGVLEIFFGA